MRTRCISGRRKRFWPSSEALREFRVSQVPLKVRGDVAPFPWVRPSVSRRGSIAKIEREENAGEAYRSTVHCTARLVQRRADNARWRGYRAIPSTGAILTLPPPLLLAINRPLVRPMMRNLPKSHAEQTNIAEATRVSPRETDRRNGARSVKNNEQFKPKGGPGSKPTPETDA